LTGKEVFVLNFLFLYVADACAAANTSRALSS